MHSIVKKTLRYINPASIVAILIFISSMFFLKRYTATLINFFQLDWIFLLLGIVLIITPFGSIKIYSEHLKSYKFIKYFSLILCFQASLYAIFIGFSRLSGQLFPILTLYQPNITADTARFLFQHASLFPWGLCLLWISAVCYFSFRFNAKRHSKIKYFLFNISPLIKLGIGIAVAFSFSVVSVCFVLQLSYILLGIKPLMIAYGPTWITVIAFLITLLILTRRRFKSLLTRLSNHSSPAFVWLIFILCCTLLIVGINTLIIGSIHAPLLIPRWLIVWQLSVTWATLWKITIASWWIAVIPIVTLVIIRLSNGYSLRTVLLTVLSFPLFVSLVLNANVRWHFFPGSILLSFANILTLLGCIAFIYFALISKAWTRALFFGKFLKHGRIKNKNYWSSLMKIRISFFSALYLMLVYGIPFLIIPAFSCAFLFFASLLIMVTLFFYSFISDYFKKQR